MIWLILYFNWPLKNCLQFYWAKKFYSQNTVDNLKFIRSYISNKCLSDEKLKSVELENNLCQGGCITLNRFETLAIFISHHFKNFVNLLFHCIISFIFLIIQKFGQKTKVKLSLFQGISSFFVFFVCQLCVYPTVVDYHFKQFYFIIKFKGVSAERHIFTFFIFLYCWWAFCYLWIHEYKFTNVKGKTFELICIIFFRSIIVTL